MTEHKSCIEAAALLEISVPICAKGGQTKIADADCCRLANKLDLMQMQMRVHMYVEQVLEVIKVKLC